nr:hypothetical protein [Mesorhizobium sp. B2-4-15]
MNRCLIWAGFSISSAMTIAESPKEILLRLGLVDRWRFGISSKRLSGDLKTARAADSETALHTGSTHGDNQRIGIAVEGNAPRRSQRHGN